MNQPSRIKTLYHEIRGTLGSEISSREALQLAAHLVDVVDGCDPVAGAQAFEQRPIFDELPVDQGLADGGWKVFNREREIVRAIFDGDDNYSSRATGHSAFGMELAA